MIIIVIITNTLNVMIMILTIIIIIKMIKKIKWSLDHDYHSNHDGAVVLVMTTMAIKMMIAMIAAWL